MASNGEGPAVGRIVHYVAPRQTGACRAALIVRVAPSQAVDVCVFEPSGLSWVHEVVYDGQRAPGSWHWPERM